MAEPMTMRFTLDRTPLPQAAEVTRAMAGTVLSTRRVGDAFEVAFDPRTDDEGDDIFLMMCEIAKVYPGAVLSS